MAHGLVSNSPVPAPNSPPPETVSASSSSSYVTAQKSLSASGAVKTELQEVRVDQKAFNRDHYAAVEQAVQDACRRFTTGNVTIHIPIQDDVYFDLRGIVMSNVRNNLLDTRTGQFTLRATALPVMLECVLELKRKAQMSRDKTPINLEAAQFQKLESNATRVKAEAATTTVTTAPALSPIPAGVPAAQVMALLPAPTAPDPQQYPDPNITSSYHPISSSHPPSCCLLM